MSAAIQRVRRGDVELSVRQWGCDRSPTLLFVHGYPDSSQVWNAVAERLSSRFHVVAYDVRGAGDSSVPARVADYALSELSADLEAVLDAVSPDGPVHLIGHDWGSIQCWEAVTQPGLCDRFASYTSISGPCLDHAGQWLRRSAASRHPADWARLAEQMMHSWYIGLFQVPAVAPGLWKLGLGRLWPDVLSRLEGVQAAPNPTQAGDGVHGIKLYRANVWPRLRQPRERRTAVPVQLIVPKRDHYVTAGVLDDIPRWAGRLWRVDVDAGHWLPLSHPDWLGAQIEAFVEYIESGETSPRFERARVRGDRKPCSGQLVLVTGAGSGIGRETLLQFAELGADVVAVDIDAEAAERSAGLARLLDANAYAYAVDVGDAEAMAGLAAQVHESIGVVDVLVNNAGIGMAGSFLDTDVADWERVLRVNLWGVIHGSRLFARQMVERGAGGTIVNVASGLAYTPTRSLPAYATSKAAVRMLSDCLRAELHDAGLRVVSVCPGIVDTGITESTRFVGTDSGEEQRLRDSAKALYQRRNLKPAAVARAIVAAVRGGRDEVPVGAEAHAGRWLSRAAPSLMRRLARVDLAL